jgi:hypothetical protein
MMENDPKSSVHDEQFGGAENTDKVIPENKEEAETISQEGASETEPAPEKNSDSKSEGKSEIKAARPRKKKVEKITVVSKTDAPIKSGTSESEEIPFLTAEHDSQADEHIEYIQDHQNEEEFVDFSKLSKEDLVKFLQDMIEKGSFYDIRKNVDLIKVFFYKKQKAEIEQIKKKFVEEGGQLQDFKIEENPLEIKLKELLERYKEFRSDYNKKVDDEKLTNLDKKYKIIEEIKELVNSQESLNRTFHEFRDLQNRWRDLGPVPQQNLKDLWESYHYQVEAFYDYIKINKELRDLDLKKNLEAKIKLCENAETLILEPSVVEAFRKLQKLHDQWREVGPVPIDKRSEIWERFKESTAKINRKHQEYFVGLKQDQKKNYEEKITICEKAEEIAVFEIENNKEWEEKSKEIIELQKIWKTIGFAPKKYNTEVYERFRVACDKFFEKKRSHYSLNREEQMNNLQLKTELCIQAEALQDSNDWKKTTDELIKLQKKWKEIGPVPVKNSEKIWKRFRAACDKFFENKSTFYSTIDSRYEENLQLKRSLIEEIKNYELTTEVEQNLNALQEFQRKWTEIGFVPIKEKNEIQEQYRKAINQKFDQLKLDDDKKVILKFRNRVENIMHKPNSQHRMSVERDKCFNKLKQMESDITLWENNIGFFAKSKNASSLIDDVNQKIANAKIKIEQLKDRIRVMDEMGD